VLKAFFHCTPLWSQALQSLLLKLISGEIEVVRTHPDA